MPSQLIIDCCKLLKEKGLTIAFAESVTAGRLAAEFSLAEDSGSVLKGGLVCYDAEVKEDVLGITAEYIEEFTPESAEVTKELAVRLKKLIRSDIQVAVTGLTTSGGSESSRKPVGTIFLHLIIKDNSIAVREVFDGTPEEIVLMTVDLAAKTIINELNKKDYE
ncbi:nicotinamide-nucleotide amidohydrolase family protein [Dyadobacter sp. CY345]|uniref:CinA family protein n=1 Tax=Dyadobacter sp. CY345 TaxID=2909335 RepID=UPI001F29B07F|nr:nicotinamide-nucleotide amidohydrolase family protein [Dyadobacter sp. CY345]MCF2446686.1 nicotinamide-nucleotide amidohydrolase family protein [Dyadobacter sp. CY345]